MQVTDTGAEVVYTVNSILMDLTNNRCNVTLNRSMNGEALTPKTFTIEGAALSDSLAVVPAGVSIGDAMYGGCFSYALQTGLIQGDIS